MNFATVVLAQAWHMDGHMGGGWWIVMMIGMVVFWGAVILAVVLLARAAFGGSTPTPGPQVWGAPGVQRETPLEILERRFAQGEISTEEYRERRDVIVGGPRP